MAIKRVIIASPVRQDHLILSEFLDGLTKLEREGLQVDCIFVDNNSDPLSSKLLKDFTMQNSIKTIIKIDTGDQYVCNERTHHWSNELIWKVADFKNQIIIFAREKVYDYLFLVDSDLILHPKTLVHLISTEKDIISEVFWTKWFEKDMYLPQVWLMDEYTFFEKGNNEKLSLDEVTKKSVKFLEMLQKPGTYKVGGLGACTLITKKALQKGVSFSKIYNLSFVGEDRHFCIRAAALGLEMYADTHYTPFHIYRNSDLPEAQEYKNKFIKPPKTQIYSPKLTLVMVVRNEADRYLKQVLENTREYIDNAVIIDDCSEDDTPELCKETLKGLPLKLVINKESMFNNEITLRKKQWNAVLETNPDWILFLDADEMFENKAKNELRKLIAIKDVEAYLFRLYDFWDENHYREDDYWQAHNFYRHFLIKYNPNYIYRWREQTQHCGRMPCFVEPRNEVASDLRIKHYGWSTPRDRLMKYKRYQMLDAGARYGIAAQYESILDPKPNLVKWQEQ